MKTIKVKVFNAYKAEEKYYNRTFDLGWHTIFDFHNHIVDKDGYVSDGPLKIKPLEKDIIEMSKYVMSDMEKDNFRIHNETIKLYNDKLHQAEKDLESWLRAEIKETGFSPDGCYLGDWDCSLSPFGICVCHWDGNDETCIYCGEPNERK